MTQERRALLKRFFIKRETQIAFISGVFFVVAVSTVTATAVILAVYSYHSQSGALYFMSNDFEKPLSTRSFLGIALPGVLAAEAVALIVGLFAAMLGSRKIAVPLFRLEQWAKKVAQGDLLQPLNFREGRPYRDLAGQVNAAGEKMRETFVRLDDALNGPSAPAPGAPENETARALEKARAILRDIRFK